MDIDYLETHYEVVSILESMLDNEHSIPYELYNNGGKLEGGRGLMYVIAKDLTDAFQEKNKDREWDGEFIDEIEDFVHDSNNYTKYL